MEREGEREALASWPLGFRAWLHRSLQLLGARLMSAAARAGDLTSAERWFEKALDARVDPNVVTYTTLISAAANQGRLEEAEDARLSTMGFPPREALTKRLQRTAQLLSVYGN
eukprot:Skav202226  [mRNA]  locus=scaffold244:64673:65310:- [translate_table: standard]